MPAYRFGAPATPVRTLERAWAIGREAGLRYVYIGNLPGHPYDNTYCPQCGEELIRRFGFDLVRCAVEDGRCPGCEGIVPGVGWGWARRPLPLDLA